MLVVVVVQDGGFAGVGREGALGGAGEGGGRGVEWGLDGEEEGKKEEEGGTLISLWGQVFLLLAVAVQVVVVVVGLVLDVVVALALVLVVVVVVVARGIEIGNVVVVVVVMTMMVLVIHRCLEKTVKYLPRGIETALQTALVQTLYNSNKIIIGGCSCSCLVLSFFFCRLFRI